MTNKSVVRFVRHQCVDFDAMMELTTHSKCILLQRHKARGLLSCPF